MRLVCPIPASLLVILDGKKCLGLYRDAPEFLPFANDIENSLIPVGLEILDFEAADSSLSQSSGEKNEKDGVITLALKGSSVWHSDNGLGLFFGEKFGLFLLHGFNLLPQLNKQGFSGRFIFEWASSRSFQP
jgi:hypothetical protein